MEGQGGILGIISKRMQWLGQRHSVVARNVANSDTPNYIPQDLTESSFRAALRKETPRAEPLRTHQAHLLSGDSAAPAKESEQSDIYEVAPSGNAVILEQELVKMNQVQAQHSLMVNLYRKHVEMMKLALRGPR